ncbi:nuclear transport factor 2 family protein [Streptomyces sp. NPDC050400]|uniref:nuclear transport factor 2 family protein n=1 Tax=Streptomyces sp. NPDC050400 TaxID=3365610 RepID=UPI003789366C
MPSTTEQRLAHAEQQLNRLERQLSRYADEAAITSLILSYGPLVDAGRADAVAALWEQDGVYDVDELAMAGREEIAAMVRSPNHQRWIRDGCAHVIGAPRVTLLDDEATAVNYSLMVVRDPETARFALRRATANHWHLRRGPQGWLVARRTSRVLDGREESPALLASGVEQGS